MEGALEKSKMLRPRMPRTAVEATIREINQRHRGLTGDISSRIITGGGLLSMPTSANLLNDYKKFKAALSRLGYFRRGSLIKRYMHCGKPGCICKASPPTLHGPYYQWTRKLDGKTVTAYFTREQADLVAGWIAAGRRMDRIIARMERLSLLATDCLLKELPSRVRKTLSARARVKRTPHS
jgi:hypothetical protein